MRPTTRTPEPRPRHSAARSRTGCRRQADPGEAAIEVRFHHCRELEPGDGPRSCLLELVGDWTPILPVDGWSDVAVRSDDARRLALVRWDGEPDPASAFRVFVLDLDHRLVTRGPHVEGRCAGLWFSDDRTLWWRTAEGALGHVAGH